MIEAIFFDLYETLITEFNPNWQPGPTVGERLGLNPDAFEAAWRTMRPRLTRGEVADFASALREICRELGHEPNDWDIRHLQAERATEKAVRVRRVEADILAMLDRIRETGVKTGLITNCAPEDIAAWDESPLAAYFDTVIVSCETGFAKPDHPIYHLACQRLAVSPEACLFFGDGADDELAGAAGVGMRPHWATWFLARWWEAGLQRERDTPNPRLGAPDECAAVVEAAVRQ